MFRRASVDAVPKSRKFASVRERYRIFQQKAKKGGLMSHRVRGIRQGNDVVCSASFGSKAIAARPAARMLRLARRRAVGNDHGFLSCRKFPRARNWSANLMSFSRGVFSGMRNIARSIAALALSAAFCNLSLTTGDGHESCASHAMRLDLRGKWKRSV